MTSRPYFIRSHPPVIAYMITTPSVMEEMPDVIRTPQFSGNQPYDLENTREFLQSVSEGRLENLTVYYMESASHSRRLVKFERIPAPVFLQRFDDNIARAGQAARKAQQWAIKARISAQTAAYGISIGTDKAGLLTDDFIKRARQESELAQANAETAHENMLKTRRETAEHIQALVFAEQARHAAISARSWLWMAHSVWHHAETGRTRVTEIFDTALSDPDKNARQFAIRLDEYLDARHAKATAPDTAGKSPLLHIE